MSCNDQAPAGCPNGIGAGSKPSVTRKACSTRWPYRPQVRAAFASSCRRPGATFKKHLAGEVFRPSTRGPALTRPAGTCGECAGYGYGTDRSPTGASLRKPAITPALETSLPLSANAVGPFAGLLLANAFPKLLATITAKPSPTSSVLRAGTGS